MYFKVEKGTNLFNQLVALDKKCKKANDAADNLGIKLGGEKTYSRKYVNVAGGIDAIRFSYTVEPDKELWMKPDRHNNPRLFYPRNSKKANEVNKQIHEDIKALPVVSYEEYNGAIGFENHWVGLCNYKTYNLLVYDNYILIEIGKGANYTPVNGMTEILESEFNKLSNDINN